MCAGLNRQECYKKDTRLKFDSLRTLNIVGRKVVCNLHEKMAVLKYFEQKKRQLFAFHEDGFRSLESTVIRIDKGLK